MGKEPSPLEETCDFAQLLEFSKCHGIVGALYGSVKISKCNGDILKKWSDNAGLSLTREILFDNELSKIERLFQEKGISYAYLKGIVLKKYYPKKGIRHFCDYDLFVDEEKIDEAKKIMVSLGYTVSRENESEKDVHEAYSVVDCFKEPIFNFELHKNLFSHNTSYFKDAWKRLQPTENQCRSEMSKEDFYIFHIAHLYSHLKERGGAGIRYLADQYILQKYFFGSLNRENVKSILEKEGLWEFESMISSLTNELFEKEVPNVLLLREFLENGVHGTTESKVQLGIEKNGKYGFLIKRIFPPLNFMRMKYKALRKAPFLLPFFWIIRAFQVLFDKKRRKNAKFELNTAVKK